MSILDKETERVLAAAAALLDVNPGKFWDGMMRHVVALGRNSILLEPVLLTGEHAKAYRYVMDLIQAVELASGELNGLQVRMKVAVGQLLETRPKKSDSLDE